MPVPERSHKSDDTSYAGERDGRPVYPRPFTYRSGEAFAADGEKVPSWLLNDREEDARCQTL